MKRFGIDPEQHVPAFHDLIVLDEDFRDEARDVGSDADHVGSNPSVPGPGRLHVVVPQRQPDHDRGGGHPERDEEAKREGEEPGHGTEGSFEKGCEGRWAKGPCRQEVRGSAIETTQPSSTTYRARSNSGRCQTRP